MTKAKQYVIHRQQGMGSREAARRAGFSGGVPSPGARDLHDALRKVEKRPAACSWVGDQLARARAKVAELEHLQAACELMAG